MIREHCNRRRHHRGLARRTSRRAPEIDARGCMISPGLIDVHLHFNEPGRTEWEGAATGSRALAAGGGTLFFDMPLNSSPCTVSARSSTSSARALEGSSITDFALWGGIDSRQSRELAELAERGVIGFKAFLCDSGLPSSRAPTISPSTKACGKPPASNCPLPSMPKAKRSPADSSQRLHGAGTAYDIPAFLASRPVIAETEAIQRAGSWRAKPARACTSCTSVRARRRGGLEARTRGADISHRDLPALPDLHRRRPQAHWAQ